MSSKTRRAPIVPSCPHGRCVIGFKASRDMKAEWSESTQLFEQLTAEKKPDERTLDLPHFRVLFYGNDRSRAELKHFERTVTKLCAEVYECVSKTLGVETKARPLLRLFIREEWNQFLAKNPGASSAAGFLDATDNSLWVCCGFDVTEQAANALAHEYTHFVVNELTRGTLVTKNGRPVFKGGVLQMKFPAWLHEGLGVYVEMKWREKNHWVSMIDIARSAEKVAQIAKSGKLPQIKSAEGTFATLMVDSDPVSVILAYVVSAEAVQAMIDQKGGMAALIALLRRVGSGVPWKKAYARAYPKLTNTAIDRHIQKVLSVGGPAPTLPEPSLAEWRSPSARAPKKKAAEGQPLVLLPANAGSLPAGFEGFDAEIFGVEPEAGPVSPEEQQRRRFADLRRGDVFSLEGSKRAWVVTQATGVNEYAILSTDYEKSGGNSQLHRVRRGDDGVVRIVSVGKLGGEKSVEKGRNIDLGSKLDEGGRPLLLSLVPDAEAIATFRRDARTGRAWLEFDGDDHGEEIGKLLKEAGWRWSGYRKQYHNNRKFIKPPEGIPYRDGGTVDYADERVERLQERAGKAHGEAAAQFERSHSITEGIPLGQPILVGHHSEGRHRRDIEKSWSAMGKGVEAQKYAEHLEAQAEGAAHAKARAEDPGALTRRIERLATELRQMDGRHERQLAEGKYPLSENQKAYRDGLAAELEQARARLAEVAGKRMIFSKETLRTGDVVLYRGGPVRIDRASTKSFSGRHMDHPVGWYVKDDYTRITKLIGHDQPEVPRYDARVGNHPAPAVAHPVEGESTGPVPEAPAVEAEVAPVAAPSAEAKPKSQWSEFPELRLLAARTRKHIKVGSFPKIAKYLGIIHGLMKEGDVDGVRGYADLIEEAWLAREWEVNQKAAVRELRDWCDRAKVAEAEPVIEAFSIPADLRESRSPVQALDLFKDDDLRARKDWLLEKQRRVDALLEVAPTSKAHASDVAWLSGESAEIGAEVARIAELLQTPYAQRRDAYVETEAGQRLLRAELAHDGGPIRSSDAVEVSRDVPEFEVLPKWAGARMRAHTPEGQARIQAAMNYVGVRPSDWPTQDGKRIQIVPVGTPAAPTECRVTELFGRGAGARRTSTTQDRLSAFTFAAEQGAVFPDAEVSIKAAADEQERKAELPQGHPEQTTQYRSPEPVASAAPAEQFMPSLPPTPAPLLQLAEYKISLSGPMWFGEALSPEQAITTARQVLREQAAPVTRISRRKADRTWEVLDMSAPPIAIAPAVTQPEPGSMFNRPPEGGWRPEDMVPEGQGGFRMPTPQPPPPAKKIHMMMDPLGRRPGSDLVTGKCSRLVSWMNTSEDPEKVTCPGCRKQMGLALSEPVRLSDSEYQRAIRDAIAWRYLTSVAATQLATNREKLRYSRITTKGDLDAWLIARFGIDASDARSISNKANELLTFTVGDGRVTWTGRDPAPSLRDYPDLPLQPPAAEPIAPEGQNLQITNADGSKTDIRTTLVPFPVGESRRPVVNEDGSITPGETAEEMQRSNNVESFLNRLVAAAGYRVLRSRWGQEVQGGVGFPVLDVVTTEQADRQKIDAELQRYKIFHISAIPWTTTPDLLGGKPDPAEADTIRFRFSYDADGKGRSQIDRLDRTARDPFVVADLMKRLSTMPSAERDERVLADMAKVVPLRRSAETNPYAVTLLGHDRVNDFARRGDDVVYRYRGHGGGSDQGWRIQTSVALWDRWVAQHDADNETQFLGQGEITGPFVKEGDPEPVPRTPPAKYEVAFGDRTWRLATADPYEAVYMARLMLAQEYSPVGAIVLRNPDGTTEAVTNKWGQRVIRIETERDDRHRDFWVTTGGREFKVAASGPEAALGAIRAKFPEMPADAPIVAMFSFKDGVMKRYPDYETEPVASLPRSYSVTWKQGRVRKIGGGHADPRADLAETEHGQYALIHPTRGPNAGKLVLRYHPKEVGEAEQGLGVYDTLNHAYDAVELHNETALEKLRAKEDEQRVAETILNQFGGLTRLRAMLGAKDFVSRPDGVSWRWPNPERQRGNAIRITLTPADLYTVEFLSISGKSVKPVKKYEEIYAQDLVKIFEEQTGWFLTMHGGTKIFGDPSEKGPSPKDVWTEQNEEIERRVAAHEARRSPIPFPEDDPERLARLVRAVKSLVPDDDSGDIERIARQQLHEYENPSPRLVEDLVRADREDRFKPQSAAVTAATEAAEAARREREEAAARGERKYIIDMPGLSKFGRASVMAPTPSDAIRRIRATHLNLEPDAKVTKVVLERPDGGYEEISLDLLPVADIEGQRPLGSIAPFGGSGINEQKLEQARWKKGQKEVVESLAVQGVDVASLSPEQILGEIAAFMAAWDIALATDYGRSTTVRPEKHPEFAHRKAQWLKWVGYHTPQVYGGPEPVIADPPPGIGMVGLGLAPAPVRTSDRAQAAKGPALRWLTSQIQKAGFKLTSQAAKWVDKADGDGAIAYVYVMDPGPEIAANQVARVLGPLENYVRVDIHPDVGDYLFRFEFPGHALLDAGEVQAASVGTPPPIPTLETSARGNPISGSWVVVSRETGKPVLETFERKTAEAINQDKYEVLTALQWAARYNEAVRKAGGVEPVMAPAPVEPAPLKSLSTEALNDRWSSLQDRLKDLAARRAALKGSK